MFHLKSEKKMWLDYKNKKQNKKPEGYLVSCYSFSRKGQKVLSTEIWGNN